MTETRMTITLGEVLSETDLVTELLGLPRREKYFDIIDAADSACEVCGALGALDYCAACGSEQDARELPKLRKLLTEPTIFDDLRSEVIAEPITESVLPKRITPNKWMRGPFQAPEMAQPVVEAPDGYRDSYFAAADRSVTDRVAAAVNDLVTTDADRRRKMAEKFDIDPDTLTDDRLDPDNWKDN